jgi:branched-chain amino acid transport system substrate-binding protein
MARSLARITWAPIVVACAVAAGGAFAAACHGGGGTAGSDAIILGEYNSLTGSEATFGQSTHQGIALAVKELNAAGGIRGKKIDLRTVDTASKVEEAGTAVTRLITSDKAVAILGEAASGRSIAGARVAQKYGVPMITPSSTNPQVTAVGDHIFRVCFVDSFQGYVLARYARENLLADKVAVLYDQAQPYSKGLAADFTREFKSRGGQVAVEQAFTGGDQDFSAQLTTIRDAAPQALVLPTYYTEGASIAIQARKLGLTMPLLGSDGWSSPQLVAIGGAAIEGATYSDHYANDEARPEVQAFVTKFQGEYGQPPGDVLAALGYDAARVLFEAMRRSDSLAGDSLVRQLAATRDFPGVTGVLTMDEKRNPRKPVVIVQIRDGKPRWVATINPP